MAIKGKKKKGGQGKPKVHAPRRDPLPPKPSPLGRRWVQLTILGIATFVMGLVIGLASSGGPAGSGTDLTAEQSSALMQMRQDTDSALFGTGAGLAGTGYVPYPDLPAIVSEFEDGKFSDQRLSKGLDTTIKSATAGAGQIQRALSRAKVLPEAQADALADAETLLVEGLGLYVQGAEMFKEATGEQGRARAVTIDRAKALLTTAQSLASRGYAIYARALREVGMTSSLEKPPDDLSLGDQPAPGAPPVGGLPPEGIPPGGIPVAPPTP